MRIALTVFVVLIAYAASYPSLREGASDTDAFELKLRSMLDHLNDKQDTDDQMARSLSSEENNEEEDAYEMSKRQGGLNKVDKTSKCEIQCIHTHRHPNSGKGKTVKEAAKACKNVCNVPNKKGDQRKTIVQRKNLNKIDKKISLRDIEDDENDSNSSEEQQNQRREFYDYLMEQLQQDNKNE